MLCNSKRTAIARSCEVTCDEWRFTTPEVLTERKSATSFPGSLILTPHRAGAVRCENNNKKQVTHSNTNPRPGQYLTHAQSHITRAVAAMDSCFGLVRPHQHGVAVGQQQDQKPYVVCPLLPRRVQSAPLSASSKQHIWELVAGNHTAVLPRYALGRWRLPGNEVGWSVLSLAGFTRD